VVQLTVQTSENIDQNFYLNLVDEMVGLTFNAFNNPLIYKPLIELISHQTGKSKIVLSRYDYITGQVSYANRDRYLQLTLRVSTTFTEALTSGVIKAGNIDFPYGFYTINIYQNTSNSNLDKTGLTQVYSGLMQLKELSTNLGVKYKEYTTNDSDTDSIYITN